MSPGRAGPKVRDDQLRRLIDEKIAEGWHVERRRRSHLAFYPPAGSGPPVFHSSTSSDRRALKNLKAQLRRAVAA